MYLSEKTENLLRAFDKFTQHTLTQRKYKRLSTNQARKFVPPWFYTAKQLFPPFTYFGGKRDIALEIWRRFGWNIPNYIEPFAGGLSVLLARPIFDLRDLKKYRELANDTNIFLLNFWRAVQQENIEDLIKFMDFPAHGIELLTRREEMMERRFELAKKIRNVKSYDPKLAAYWLYIQRQWIGAGADDPSAVPTTKMVRAKETGFLGDSLEQHIRFIQARTRSVRFFEGDWQRPLKKPTQSINIGTTGVFMDPPYVGTTDYYTGRLDDGDPANAVPLAARDWALKYGKYPEFRIAYCGYLHHHDGIFPEGGKNGWIKFPWKKANGYSTPGEGKTEQIETVWFSPHCIRFPDDSN